MELWLKKDNHNVSVEAVRLNEDNAAGVAQWAKAGMVEEIDPEHPEETQVGLNVVTPSGVARASLGMYVIKFGGSFMVSRVRAFEELYEPANRQSPPPESAGDSRKARGFADPFDSGRFGP